MLSELYVYTFCVIGQISSGVTAIIKLTEKYLQGTYCFPTTCFLRYKNILVTGIKDYYVIN